MSFAVPSVKTKGKFVDVAAKMLRTRMMINPMQTPLEDRPHAVDAVGGHAILHIFPGTMVYRLMPVEQTIQAGVNRGIIGMNHGTQGHMVKDCAVQRRFIRADKWFGDCIAAPFPKPDNPDLADGATASQQLLFLMLGGFLAPDVSFVNLDDAPEFRQIIATGFPEPMQHEPGRFLGNAYLLGKLQGRYALPGRHKQIHGIKPFMKRDMRPLKDGSGTHREILNAGIAAAKAAFQGMDSLHFPAMRTLHAFRPQPGFKVFPGRFLIREHLEKLKSGNGDFVIHANIITIYFRESSI